MKLQNEIYILVVFIWRNLDFLTTISFATFSVSRTQTSTYVFVLSTDPSLLKISFLDLGLDLKLLNLVSEPHSLGS